MCKCLQIIQVASYWRHACVTAGQSVQRSCESDAGAMAWVVVGYLCVANAIRTLQLFLKGKVAVSPTGDKVGKDWTGHTYYLCTRNHSHSGLAMVEIGIALATEIPLQR